MVDVPFTTFAFRATTGTTTRTMPNRLDDVFNVKDFGAAGNGSADDRAAIQAAADAAMAKQGAILFFPPGIYHITASITFAGNTHGGIKILGSGGAGDSQGASCVIQGSFRDYLFKFTYPGGVVAEPLHSIQDLQFHQQFNIGTSQVDCVDTAGCIFIPGGIGPRIYGCSMYIQGGGVALYSLAQNMGIYSCNCLGPYFGTNATQSIGFMGQNLTVSDCKIYALGYGIVASAGINASFTTINNIDFEEIGTPISIGAFPIQVLANVSPGTGGGGTLVGPFGGVHGGSAISRATVITNINVEAPGDYDGSSQGVIFLSNTVYGAFLSGIFIYADHAVIPGGAQGVTPPYGIRLEGGINCFITCVDIAGSSGTAGGLTHAAYSMISSHGITFHGCRGTNSHTGGVVWDYLSNSFGAGDNGITWQNCDTDGALPKASLPPSPVAFGQTMVCSDATQAFSPTNVGAAIVGGGTHKVLARWNGVAWTYAG